MTTTTTSKTNWFYEQNNSSARASRFEYVSLTSTARLGRETNVLWRTWTYEDEFSFLFLNLDKVCKNSTLRENGLHLTNRAGPDRRDKVWKDANSLFYARFFFAFVVAWALFILSWQNWIKKFGPPWKPTYDLFQAFNWSKINCGKIHISKRTRLGVSFSVPLCTTLESFRFEDENEYEYEI